MKHIIIITLIVFTGLAVKAQPAGGHFFLGGTLGFSYAADKSETGGTSEKNSTNTTYSILPTAGIFLGERFALGVLIGFTGSAYKNPDPVLYEFESSKYRLFSIGPFFRYYIISGKGGIFAEVSVITGIGGNEYNYFETDDYEGKTTQISAGFSPGVYYYVTKKIAIEAQIGWLGYETTISKYESLFDNDTEYVNNNFGFDITPSAVSFGAIVMF